MKAILNRLHSPDVADLAAFSPESADFGFLLQLMVGPKDAEGEESFDLTVCTPGWLATRLTDSPLPGRGYLFVREYSFRVLESYLRKQVERVEGSTWAEVASKLSRLGQWEFEDYAEEPV